MMKIQTYRRFFVLIGLLLMSQGANAQKKELDALVDSIAMIVYDQPDSTIESSLELMAQYEDDLNLQIKLLIIISNAYSSKRDYQKSLDYALEAKEVNKKQNNYKLELQILNKIAAQYHQLGVNDKALQILDEADQLAERYPSEYSIRFTVGNNYAIRGFIYRDQLSCDIAIDYLNKAYRVYSENLNDPKAWGNRSVTTYNKGNCFITLNQLDSAKIAFHESKKLAVQAKANSLQAFSMKGLAEVYTLEGRYTEAIQVLDSAYVIAANVGDLVLNRGIYKGLSDNYLALQDWDNFQINDDKFRKVEQQIRMIERNTIHAILQDYELESSAKQEKIKWNYGLAIGVFSLGILVLFYLILKGELNFRAEFSQLREKIKF